MCVVRIVKPLLLQAPTQGSPILLHIKLTLNLKLKYVVHIYHLPRIYEVNDYEMSTKIDDIANSLTIKHSYGP